MRPDEQAARPTCRLRLALSALLAQALSFYSRYPRAESVSPARVDRLVELCRLWNAIRFFDPDLKDETDPLADDALIAALPYVDGANGLKTATGIMLANLHDPLTTLDVQTEGEGPIAMPSAENYGRIRIVHLNGYPSASGAIAYTQTLTRVMTPAADTQGICF